MIERVVTHKNLTFSERDLLRYLKTVPRFSKIEEEILATLTYKHEYQRQVIRSALYISFPYKESSEEELDKRSGESPDKIGYLIREFIEENSPIDSILVNQRSSRPSYQKLLQIKFFGRYGNSHSTNDDFISFLGKYSTYAPTDIALIILSDKSGSYRPETIAKWLKENKFPFREVVLIRTNSPGDKPEFYTLKP